MLSQTAIEQFIAERRATYVSAVRLNEFAGTLLLEVPVEKVRAKAGGGFTSRRQIVYLSKSLEKAFEIRVVTIFREARQDTDIEGLLLSVLKGKFPGMVASVVLSYLVTKRVYVWVETARVLDGDVTSRVEASVWEFLSALNIGCDGVEILGSALPEPSVAAILRSIKRLAPVDIASLQADLLRRGFSINTEKWLAGKLDVARKHGLLIRNPAGGYILTARGIEGVPSSRSRQSSDIERVLWLARRTNW